MRYYIDCEFDGHSGPLLSLAMVREEGVGLHIQTWLEAPIRDRWVEENVMSVMDFHEAERSHVCTSYKVGYAIRAFIGDDASPCVIADSPVDIGRFCHAISTGENDVWASVDYPRMDFEVHNVECYPTDLEGAVQHNAWWDAMALREKLTEGIA